MPFSLFSMKFLVGVGYFKRPGPEVDYFYTHFGLEIILLTLTEEPESPMPSSVIMRLSLLNFTNNPLENQTDKRRFCNIYIVYSVRHSRIIQTTKLFADLILQPDCDICTSKTLRQFKISYNRIS